MTRRFACGVMVVVACLLVGAVPGRAQDSEPGPTVSQQVDQVFEAWGTGRTPGCAVGVSRGGRTVYTQGYGLANLEYGVKIRPDTIFESGSVAKQFTAGAILMLVADGKLSLDDPARKYLPELPDFGAPILVRHLLGHTSGLRSQWPLLTLAGRPAGLAVHTIPEILELVAAQKELNFRPGEEFLYNNTAFTLASVIVARVSGQSFDEFSRERLFKPLGMSKTQWRDDYARVVEGRAAAYRRMPDGTFKANASFTSVVGNGGLLTTVGDLLLWNANLDNPKVGGKAFADALQTSGTLNDGTPTGYGLGLFIQDYQGVREISHGGSTAGYQTFLARFPDEKLSVAVLCNTTGGNPGGYAHQVADIFLRSRLKPAEKPKAIAAPADALERLAGVYRDRATDALLRLVWDKDRKAVRLGGQVLLPSAPGVLTPENGGDPVIVDAGAGAPAWPAAGPPLSVTATLGALKARAFHFEAPFAPTAGQLLAYEGEYFSDELGVVYRLVVEDGRLIARFRPAQRHALAPVFADGFEGEGNVFRFTRNGAGTVDGFRVYAGRVRHLRFVKR